MEQSNKDESLMLVYKQTVAYVGVGLISRSS